MTNHENTQWLREERAAALVGWCVRYFRRFDLPYRQGPGRPIKGNRLYRVSDLLAWREKHGTSREVAARRARQAHTGQTWIDADGERQPWSKSPHYNRIRGAIRRCTEGNHERWDDYGGRGICVYEPWRENTIEFHNYLVEVLGPCPEGHTLDRIDNDRGYEPGNLRWADAYTQNQNRRRFAGEELEWEGCAWCLDGLHDRDELGRPLCPFEEELAAA